MKENKLIVASRQWADTIPEWILNEVKAERMIYGLAGILNPDAPKVGDAEVIVYLYTLGLQQPLTSEDTNIYLYVTGRLLKKTEREIPDFIQEQLDKGLTDYEQQLLKDLKYKIYTRRGGEITHPVLDVMRNFKKDIDKLEEKRKGMPSLENWI